MNVCYGLYLQKPMILDPTCDGEKNLNYLGGLLAKLNALQDKAFQYKSYQKKFKVNTYIS